MGMRHLGWAAAAFSVAVLASATTVAPASASALVLHPDGCGFTAGSVDGVEVEISATSCTVVHSSGGVLIVKITASLPQGYSFKRAYVGGADCDDAAGSLRVTPTGRVMGTCVIR